MIDRKVHSGFVRPPDEPNADDIKASVDEFLEANPVTPGASAEESAQIKLNTQNIEKLQTLSEGLDTVVISNSKPNTENKCLWIQSGQYESFDIPQINDETVSEEDTWSSKKISDEFSIQVGQLSDKVADLPKKIVAKFTGEGTENSPYVCDKSHKELYDAFYEGYEVTAKYTGSILGQYYSGIQLSLQNEPHPIFEFYSEIFDRKLVKITLTEFEYIIVDIDDINIIKSSTSGSTKKFKISVDDYGTISATEVT